MRTRTQSEVAKRLRVSRDTLPNWEQGRNEALVAGMPAIYRFVGEESLFVRAFRRGSMIAVEIRSAV